MLCMPDPLRQPKGAPQPARVQRPSRGGPDPVERLDLPRVRKILVVRLDEIGDVIMTVPFLRSLRQSCPAASITLVVKPALADLMRGCPYVDRLLTFSVRRPRRLERLRRLARTLWFASRHLWLRRPDLALVPRYDVDFGHASMLVRFAGARCSIAYSESVTPKKQALSRGSDRAFTHLMRESESAHEVQRNLDMLRFLGADVDMDEQRIELWPNSVDEAFARKLLSSQGVPEGALLVGFGPGKHLAQRRWPLDRFIELGERLCQGHSARIVVVGGRDEEAMARRLVDALGDKVVNAVGRTSIRETIALLARCSVFVGNDSGPVHMAAAAGTPVVEISCHPRDGSPLHTHAPERFRPWGVRSRILRPETGAAPCAGACVATEPHCILEVEVEHAHEAVAALLADDAGASLPRGPI